MEEFKYRPREDGSQNHDVGLDTAVQRALHESAERMIHEGEDASSIEKDRPLTLEDMGLKSSPERAKWIRGLPTFTSNEMIFDVLGRHAWLQQQRIEKLELSIERLTEQVNEAKQEARSALAAHVSKSRRV